MASQFHEALAERVAPYFPDDVRLVAVTVSPSPDTETGHAEAAPAEVAHVPATRRATRAQEPPEGLPPLGLFADYGEELGLEWAPVGEAPTEVLDLARRLPVARAQADALVLRVAADAVSELLVGDLRVDAADGRTWIFLFTREPCAVRLRGGWVLAAHHGHAALFREVPVVRAVEIPWPPLDPWVNVVVLEDALRLSAADGADLAGLVLRHGRFEVADPVAALLSGEEAPPVRVVRAWVTGLGDEQLEAIEAEVLSDLEAMRDVADEDVRQTLVLRDRVESRVRVLSLAAREGEVRAAVADADTWARARGLGASPSAPEPRLRAAWLEPGPHWWARR